MRNKMRQIFSHFDVLRLRVLMMLVFVNVLIIGIFGSLITVAFQRSFLEEIGTTRSDVLSQIGERARTVKHNAYTISNLYYYDTNLKELLVNASYGNNREEAEEYFKYLSQRFTTSFDQFGLGYTAVIAFEKGGGLCSVPVSDDYDYMRPQNKIWYKKVYQGRGDIVDIACYKDKFLKTSSFSVARTISNKEGEPIAYLMINIDERKIYDMYRNVISDTSNIYVVDPEGTIISSSIENLRGFNLFSMSNLDKLFGDSPYVVTQIQGRESLFTRYIDESTGFTVLEEIPLDALSAPIYDIRGTVIAIALIAVVLASIWAWQFSKKMIVPIQQLADFMTGMEGDKIEEECTITGYAEINQLSSGLNKMLCRIRTLVQSVKQQEQQKRKMELGFLQAQINPHFMHNTLFSVKCMVDMHKNTQASAMLTSFIILLRGTLSNPDEFVTVQTEFEQLQQYADIQRFRYSDQLQIYLDCDPQAMNKKIPKLLVQPLLENAIFHGVEGNGGNGCVFVIARLINQQLIISVEDDGAGISPSQLEILRKGTMQASEHHIGVTNVRERIQLYFGNEYGLEIESTVGQGTCIRLNLPEID